MTDKISEETIKRAAELLVVRRGFNPNNPWRIYAAVDEMRALVECLEALNQAISEEENK